MNPRAESLNAAHVPTLNSPLDVPHVRTPILDCDDGDDEDEDDDDDDEDDNDDDEVVGRCWNT